MNTFLLMAALREHFTPALAGLPLPTRARAGTAASGGCPPAPGPDTDRFHAGQERGA